MRTEVGENMRVAAFKHDRRFGGVQLRRLLVRPDQRCETLEDSVLDRARHLTVIGLFPVHPGPVQPAVVGGVIRVV